MIWFAEFPHGEGDFFACVFRHGPDKPWEARYRFRYYRDDKAFDSTDKKNAYAVTMKQLPGVRERAIAAFDFLTKLMPGVHRIEVNAIGADATAVIMRQPWAHAKFEGAIDA